MLNVVSDFADWQGSLGASVKYGGGSSAMDVAISVLVCDGDDLRKQRNNFFNPEYKVCGAYTGSHAEYDTMATLFYAQAVKGEGNASEAKSIDE